MKRILLISFIALPSFLLAQAPALTFTPLNGATNINPGNTIIIFSDQALKHADASTIDDTNVDAIITLVDAGANPVSFDAVINGPKTQITITPSSPLADLTSYTVTIGPVENGGGQETTQQSATFTTGDFTTPVVNMAKGVTNTGTGFTFTINVNENATVYYVVDNDNTVPSTTEILAGENGDGNTADASGNFAVTQNTNGTASIVGLTYSHTRYYVYYFVKDASANQNPTAVDTRSLPVLSSSSIQNLASFDFDLRVNIDEDATTYYVLTQSNTAPTAAQILAGQNESGGAPDQSGNFAVTAGNDIDQNIAGLTDGVTYYVHFLAVDSEGNQSVVGTESASTPDGSPPVVSSLNPLDGATTVDISTNDFIITFNENVTTINSAATDATQRVRLYENGVLVETIDRDDTTVGLSGAIIADGSSNTATITFVYNFKANTNYYILVGANVFEDNAGNNFAGLTATTDWNFTTSTVGVNNAASDICSGSFQTIGDIVLTETGPAAFNTGAGQTLILSLDNTSEFVISNSGVSVTGTSADITTLSVSVGLTNLTVTYTVAGGSVMDAITITGLKVYATGSVTTANIIRTGGTADQDGNNGTNGTSPDYATINVGAVPPSPPTLAAAQDVLYCENEDISAATVAVNNDGGTFTWYSNSSLTSQLATGFQVDVVADLGISSASVGTFKRYVVRIDGCQSTALEVTIEVAPVPVADAGAATATICNGSSVTLGGTPTLTGPSVSGAYQYLWSTNSPAGFTDLGSNPSVSPAPVINSDTTFYYTVKIIDANGCASDITDPNATIAVEVDSTDEVIVYNSPLGTSFSLNSDPIELNASPSISSTYSGNGVYLSAGKYYFDPDLAGTAGSPHAITYTTTLTNGCEKTEVRNFSVSNSSTILNLANSYCVNEAADPGDVLALGQAWSDNLASNNAYYSANYGYTYEFYDFQTYVGTNVEGTGVVGSIGNQYINPATLQPYPYGSGTYAYVGMRVRRRYPETVFGVPTGNYLYDPPQFWAVQYVNIFPVPVLKVVGVKSGQIICDVNQNIDLEANFTTGIYEISRDGINWVSGPSVGIVDNPFNSGKALFNPHNAYISTGFAAPNNTPASGIKDFYIRYTYVVAGTMGSNSSPCETTLIIPFQISNNPAVAWIPLAETEFCYEAANVQITVDQTGGTTFAGYGIFDNLNGTAILDPDEALKAKAFGTNSPPYTNYNSPEDIVISATRTDVNGCFTTIQQTVQVHPLFPASFTESDLTLCYEDGAQDIVGGQPNGDYDLSHPNLLVNFNQTSINGFNLRTYYDQAVANGADGTVNQNFSLTFNTHDPVLMCGNSVTKVFSMNPPIQMDIGGMTSGMIVCGNGAQFELTGNQPSAGSFEISTNPSSGFVANALGLNNTTSGKATYTPSGAGVPAGDPQKSLYIRYSFLGPGCTGSARTTEELIINPQPAVSFAGSIPAGNTQYCFEQAASPTTVNLTTVQTTNVTFTGFGITDNGGGSAIFNPTSAYQQSSLADNLNPYTDQTTRNITITATRTDAYNCVNTTNVVYIVNPLPTATFAPGQVEYCYEDDPVTLSGGQTNVSWQYIYKNSTTPANYSPGVTFAATKEFDPQALFDDAVVNRGANKLATLLFDVIYTAINNTTGCTNQLAPVTFTVSPKIDVTISGADDGDIYCSNITDKVFEFTPPNGTFRRGGLVEPYDQQNQEYVFNPPIAGPATGTDYLFTYTVLSGNNCTNTDTLRLKVLPSPKALFSVVPQCDTALITYAADPSTNLGTTVYTWSLSDSIRTGQSLQHRFPGVSTYSVQLKTEHPAYMGDPTLVCADSLRLDQIVGPYPHDLDFTFFNVCEGDNTNFAVSSTVPISRVAWDFGDGEVTALGVLSDPLVGPATTGTYQQPVHQYAGANDQITVSARGRTSENFGGCEIIIARDIAILKKWVPSVTEPSYRMSQLNNGNGFWVVEDKKGNTSWEFNTAAKTQINTGEQAWVTGPTTPYKPDDDSYVNSPCFDLTAFSRPVISLQHWTDTESSDGAVLQYSVDGGFTWQRLGDVASGLEWYNRLTISSNPGQQPGVSSGWSLANQLEWTIGKHTLDVLPIQRQKVRFRVAFSSFSNVENRDGFAFNNVVIEERNRTVLVENFTNLDPEQAANNDAFKNFRAVNGVFNTVELVKLQYHHTSAQNDVPPDQLNQDNPVDQNARAGFYGVTNAVRAFIDGGFGQSSNNATFTSTFSLNTYFSLRSLVTSPVDIGIDFEADPNATDPSKTLNVKATVQATADLVPGRYNVFIAIAEQQVLGQVYVLRKLLPTASGTPLTAVSPLAPAQVIYATYDMRHVTRLQNGEFAPFAVIVFVQNLETKEVLQTIMRQDGTASPDVVTGIETPFENVIGIYPNPADDVLNIILPAPVNEETPVTLFDTFGKQVYNGTFKVGENTKAVATKGLSGGVYLIQLNTPVGVVRKKAMVVHE